MRRATITSALIGLLAAAPCALALPPTGDAAVRPLALVQVAECSRGPADTDRHATFRAKMRRVPGAARMAMRLSLQERVGDAGFRTVKAPGLGTWRRSYPGVRRFSHRQRVLALAQGSSYRAVVSFRWYDADGELLRRTRRHSKPCGQPGLLPNLGILHIAAGEPVAGTPRSYAYRVWVINRGRATAPRFNVSLAVDGGVLDTQSVAPLAAEEVRQVSFTGLACEGSLTLRVDPENAVREGSEKDNVLVAPCTAPQ